MVGLMLMGQAFGGGLEIAGEEGARCLTERGKGGLRVLMSELSGMVAAGNLRTREGGVS